MSRVSPTLEGFRAAYRLPSLAFAEISWRWTVGAATCALLVFASIEYLGTLPVTNRDLLLLRTRQPFLVAQTIAHILGQGMGRAVMAAVVGALAMMALWVLIASFGRTATIRALAQYFSVRRSSGLLDPPGAGSESVNRLQADPDSRQSGEANVPANVDEPNATVTSPIRATVELNCLRAALALAAILGVVASFIAANVVSPDDHPRPGLAFLLFLFLTGCVCVFSGLLNWILSLAAIFAGRDGSALEALSLAGAFVSERFRPVAAVSTWMGIAHLSIFVLATSVVSFPLGLMPILSPRVVALLMALLGLGYFAVADWLYVARLAGYVCIAEMPEELLRPSQTPPVLPPAVPIADLRDETAVTRLNLSSPIQTTIDRDEPILSDVSDVSPPPAND